MLCWPQEGSGIRGSAPFCRSRQREKSLRFGQGVKCALHLARARKHTRAIRRTNRAGADARPLARALARITRELEFRRSGKPGGGENGMEWNETG